MYRKCNVCAPSSTIMEFLGDKTSASGLIRWIDKGQLSQEQGPGTVAGPHPHVGQICTLSLTASHLDYLKISNPSMVQVKGEAFPVAREEASVPQALQTPPQRLRLPQKGQKEPRRVREAQQPIRQRLQVREGQEARKGVAPSPARKGGAPPPAPSPSPCKGRKGRG